MIEIHAIIEQKLAAGEAVAETWLIETLLARHDEGEDISADDIRLAVKQCFLRFDPPTRPKAIDGTLPS